jgi:hypothetical protein
VALRERLKDALDAEAEARIPVLADSGLPPPEPRRP